MVQYILADSSHVGVLHGIRGSYGSPMEYHTVIIIIVSSLINNPCMENLSRFWSLGFNSCSWQKTQTGVTRPMSVDLTVSVYLRRENFFEIQSYSGIPPEHMTSFGLIKNRSSDWILLLISVRDSDAKLTLSHIASGWRQWGCYFRFKSLPHLLYRSKYL